MLTVAGRARAALYGRGLVIGASSNIGVYLLQPMVKAFAAAIRGEGISGYTVDDAIQTLRIIETAHESAESGRTITLPE